MTKVTEKLWQEVLEHWTANYLNALSGNINDIHIESEHCAFCRTFRTSCSECPLISCVKSPWRDVADDLWGLGHIAAGGAIRRLQNSIKKELDFLDKLHNEWKEKNK